MKFRDRIIAELSRSRFAGLTYTPEEAIEQASKLGVAPDTLVEACLLRKERVGQLDSKSVQKSRYKTLTLLMNDPVRGMFSPELERRGAVEFEVFSRSIVFHYLMSTADPPVVHASWREICKDVSHGSTTQLGTVPQAAGWVLSYRAERLRCTVGTLLRTLLINTLRGSFFKHGAAPYILRASQMPHSVHEYPGFTQEELAVIADNMQRGFDPVWERTGLSGERRAGRGEYPINEQFVEPPTKQDVEIWEKAKALGQFKVRQLATLIGVTKVALYPRIKRLLVAGLLEAVQEGNSLGGVYQVVEGVPLPERLPDRPFGMKGVRYEGNLRRYFVTAGENEKTPR